MLKKLIASLAIIIIVLSQVTQAHALEIPELYSKYAYLYDIENGQVYLDVLSEDKMYPASMTKIVTTIVAIEAVDDLDDKVTVTWNDFTGLYEEGASLAGLRVGTLVSYRDLLYGIMLPSGADACYSAANNIFGSQEAMVEAMNELVASLGLTNTHFANTTGLHDDNHYTTCRDMATLLEYALQNEEFVKVFEARTYEPWTDTTWNSTLERAYLLRGIDTSMLDGAKSGFTDEAELTLASTMTIDGRQLMLVTAFAEGQRSGRNVMDAVTVFNYMSQNYKNYTFFEDQQEMHSYYVTFSIPFLHTIVSTGDVNALVPNTISEEDIHYVFEGKTVHFNPINEGDELGRIQIMINDEVFDTIVIINDSSIEYSFLAVTLGAVFIVTVILLLIKLCLNLKRN